MKDFLAYCLLAVVVLVYGAAGILPAVFATSAFRDGRLSLALWLVVLFANIILFSAFTVYLMERLDIS